MRYFRAAWTVLWKSAAFLLAFGVFLLPWLLLFEQTLKGVPGDRRHLTQAYFDATACVAVLAASWFMARVVERRPFVSLGFAPTAAPAGLAAGAALGVAWMLVAVGLLAALGRVSLPEEAPGRPPWLGWAAVALACNAVTQEALCRGYLFQTARSHTNPACAVVLTSVLFTALHAGAFRGAWLPAANVFGAGVLFGLAYQLSGNLWLPVAAHFAWNFALGPVLGMVVSGQGALAVTGPRLVVDGPEWLTGGPFGLEGGLATTAATAVMTTAVVVWFRQRRAPKPAGA